MLCSQTEKFVIFPWQGSSRIIKVQNMIYTHSITTARHLLFYTTACYIYVFAGMGDAINVQWFVEYTLQEKCSEQSGPCPACVCSTINMLGAGFQSSLRRCWRTGGRQISKLELSTGQIFTFTRPSQCLSCRGHFYYRTIPCQYKVHINITRMEVVTSQIRKTW